MLTLRGITKEYVSGSMKVNALRGVDLDFGENEFAAILGPSGCGKTTLLNIIGGLDQYTDGDLLIGGKSTKQFREKDWNTYRNHSVGFVFQSYNLIPHQTALANVELALTLAGVNREERRKRAIEALEKVGLHDQMKKKPNEMSGGQMQRVAIARALVNNPEILLADEPTGALDSETSIQVMEILREVARDRLVIMVTHNPELAETYATRIIRLLDGKVVSDSASEGVRPRRARRQEQLREADQSAAKKPSMSLKTALSLSLNNLMTKKGRTILTAFAGSIGIIGIALILSLSNGVNNYIDKIQRDVLSSYPITIDAESMDIEESLNAILDNSDEDEHQHSEGQAYSNGSMTKALSSWMSGVKENDLHRFKKWLEDPSTGMDEWVSGIQYEYSTPLIVYRMDTETPMQVNPSTALQAAGIMDAVAFSGGVGIQQTMIDSMENSTNVFGMLLDNDELLKSQYDILEGRMPESMFEVVVILDSNNELSDMTLYTLGLKDQSELKGQYAKLMKGESVESQDMSYSYDTLMGMQFRLLINTDYYMKKDNLWIDQRNNETYMADKLANSIPLTVVGIARVSEDTVAAATASGGGIGYRRELMDYVLKEVQNSEIFREQMANPTINVFTGSVFSEKPQDALERLNDMEVSEFITLLEEEGMIPKGMIPDALKPLITKDLMVEFIDQGTLMIEGTSLEGNLKALGVCNPKAIIEYLDGDAANDPNRDPMDNPLEYPTEYPSSIRIYPKDFEAKNEISRKISEYNQQVSKEGHEEETIQYTDYVGLLMDSVTTIVNSITYVLIAFVAISLVVSSIMIGIITYISVLERTKEIGILRAIGASRRDISRVFNAETLIIGFTAGVIGIAVTLILVVIMNIILHNMLGIRNLASLPLLAAVILVGISMTLTLIAGLIPSRIAARKDPVVALRTE